MQKRPDEMLKDLAAIFAERNPIYGDNFIHFGKIMTGLFPDGLALKTEDDFIRIGMFVQIVSKVSRYAPNLVGGGHADSLDDIAVYAQMLQYYDNMKRSDQKELFDDERRGG